MPVQRKYDDETRARAVRLYVERRKSDPAESQVASRRHVGGLIGVGPETLRGWVEREERNAGATPAAMRCRLREFVSKCHRHRNRDHIGPIGCRLPR